MYYVSKTIEIAGAHKLVLPYDSKCSNIHGHNWVVTVYCKSKSLTSYGMVIDFTKIKSAVHDKLDHKYINEVLGDLNPTAENIAKWICDTVTDICNSDSGGYCYRVSVQESNGNIAIYEVDSCEGC